MTTRGVSLAELLLVVALVALAALTAVPPLADAGRRLRMAAAARELALTVQALRWRSVSSGRSHGLRFAEDGAGWHWVVVRDGNGNGLRSREIDQGIDRIVGGEQRIGARVAHVRLGFPPGLRRVPRVPPGRGTVDVAGGAVRIGRSPILSLSPLGSATGGTLYLTDGRRLLWAVVIYGRTARTRVWRYRVDEGAWRR